MKIQQLEFVIAVAQEGSITKASRKLAIAQPNISSSLKELELEIGFKIFQRMPDGMDLTPEGKVFLQKAQHIVNAIQELRHEYCADSEPKFTLSVAFSYSAYASEAIIKVLREFCEKGLNFDFHIAETSTQNVLEEVIRGKVDFGLIHLPEIYFPHVQHQLTDRNLTSEIIMHFRMQLLMRADHPLAAQKEINISQLEEYPELLYEIENPETYHQSKISRKYDLHSGRQKIYVTDRGMQINLLKALPNAYMWVSPIPDHRLEKEGLVLKPCPQAINDNVDMIIFRTSLLHDPQLQRIVNQVVAAAQSMNSPAIR